MPSVQLYDTTLRDGAQKEGVSFSVVDKLHIAQKLDELGIHYIEGGYPGSNPRDAEFFKRAQKLKLTNSQIAVFGSTRRPNIKAANDTNLAALIDSGARIATIVAKCSDMHVTRVLETTLDENLSMISDSIEFLKANGIIVFLDAEHYFDGFKSDPDFLYAACRLLPEPVLIVSYSATPMEGRYPTK